jgi:hypothetical protein
MNAETVTPHAFPPVPGGVRIDHPDGTSTPVEITYTGWDAYDRLHVWAAALPAYRVTDGAHVTTIVDLPARTTVKFVLEVELGPGQTVTLRPDGEPAPKRRRRWHRKNHR